ncbi:MAG TPA: hypothetical protein ENJ44_01780 [Oceanospirillales bacterium]|nr:hypothetical protein [Oceanospirillales bacterium]
MKKQEFERLQQQNTYEQTIAKSHNSLYSSCLIIGIILFAYIYFYDFDSYSETELISMTPLWMFPLIFGFYGFMAQKMLLQDQENKSIYKLLTNNGLLYQIMLPLFPLLFFPFFFIKSKSPIIIALLGSLLWVGIMLFFFAVIFPAL